MGRVVVVTDSAAALPQGLADKYSIQVVPLLLHWDGTAYRDGIDIAPGEVYRRLRGAPTLPTTSAPSVGDFVQTYIRWAREGVEGIVSVHIASALSATYEEARVAGEVVRDVVNVRVVDSGTAAMGLGFAALAAARAASRGARLEEVAREAEEVARRATVLAMLDTLEYLYRSGRVPRIASLMGAALELKPVVCLRGGEVDVIAKPRTRRKAVEFILHEMEREVGNRPVHVAVMHADAPAAAERARQEVAKRFQCLELHVTEFTPVMGTAAGPGLVGLAFYDERERADI